VSIAAEQHTASRVELEVQRLRGLLEKGNSPRP